jgi:hypothetical protein
MTCPLSLKIAPKIRAFVKENNCINHVLNKLAVFRFVLNLSERGKKMEKRKVTSEGSEHIKKGTFAILITGLSIQKKH